VRVISIIKKFLSGLTNTVGRVASGWLADQPCVSPLIVSIVASAAGESQINYKKKKEEWITN
jgi:hypothetical protein